MFAQHAYEAFYTYIGLYLHETFIKIITSQEVLVGILALIFGGVFFFAVWDYFKKYIPFWSGGPTKSFQVFFRLLFCFFLGISILKVGSSSDVKNFKRISWSDNQYITAHLPEVNDQYEVSFLFDLLTRSSEEIARLGALIIDEVFKQTNSQLDAPDAFYKAVLYSGSLSLDDPKLRNLIDLYSQQCFDGILPLVGEMKKKDRFSFFFNSELTSDLDAQFRDIPVHVEDGPKTNCLEVKNKVRDSLYKLAIDKTEKISPLKEKLRENSTYTNAEKNIAASSLLVDYYFDKTETSTLGIEKGAELPGKYSSFILRLKRFFSTDGLYNIFGGRSLEGSGVTADRALQFSEYLKRVPHIKGIFKMALIAVFPFLVFFVFFGKWRIIIAWWITYMSLALWTPIFLLLYKLMTAIALSTETMVHFGKLVDGVSLYSGEFISARLYQFFAIYTWLQLLLGPLPTSILAWKVFSGALRDNQEDHAPEGVGTIANTAIGAATGGASGVAAGGFAGGVSGAVKGGGKAAAQGIGSKVGVSRGFSSKKGGKKKKATSKKKTTSKENSEN